MDEKDIRETTVRTTKDDVSLKDDASLNDTLENAEWGENHQERILDKAPRRKSARHLCKGPSCVKAFEKS